MSTPPATPRRLLAIFNPTAGRRARGKLERWHAALAAFGARVTLAETKGPMHALDLARGADPARFDAIAVAGGDGTINEALNGLDGPRLPVALLPLGTANVLASELGLPRDLEALARLAALGPAREIVPGTIQSAAQPAPWRFLLMAGIGFDAEVVARLDARLKRRIGKGAYAVGSLAELARNRRQVFSAAVDGRDASAASFVVARAHFYGGRFVLAAEARLDRPLLYAVSFPMPGRAATLRYLAAVLAGRIGCARDVAIEAARHVVLSGPAGAPVQVDGDVRAYLPATIGLASSPVRLIA